MLLLDEIYHAHKPCCWEKNSVFSDRVRRSGAGTPFYEFDPSALMFAVTLVMIVTAAMMTMAFVTAEDRVYGLCGRLRVVLIDRGPRRLFVARIVSLRQPLYDSVGYEYS